MHEISQLELDLILLFYTFSDQYGRVDVQKVNFLARDRLGVILPNSSIMIEQKHVDVLVQHGILPDVMSIFENVKTIKPKRKKK